jgi:hypothetical protein
MFGQPRRRTGVPDVDRVPLHVRRRRRGGHPAGGRVFRPVLGDRLAKKLILVLRRTPAAIDVELDAVVRGIRCSLAQGPEQFWIEVGHSRNPVIEDRYVVGDGTVSLAKCTLAVCALVVAMRSVDGW